MRPRAELCARPGCDNPVNRDCRCCSPGCARRLLFSEKGLGTEGFLRARFEELSFPEAISGCVLWAGSANHSGYGRIQFCGKSVAAHRLAWRLENGEIPRGLFVCHRCDTPACVNPAHMFLGTSAENNADRGRKGRTSRMSRNAGESSGQAKLSAKDVLAIRAAYAAGKRQCDLAEEFRVTRPSIRRIVLRVGWVRVGDQVAPTGSAK
jgi:hypothetical protein